MQQPDEEATSATEPPRPGLMAGARDFGRALKAVFGAQLALLRAEWALARSAIAWMFVAGLAATVAGVGFALTALALLGLVLATWWGSWLWALIALAALQLAMLGAAVILFRRCMHWLSLPLTRSQWTTLVRLSPPAPDPSAAAPLHQPAGES